MVIIDDSNRKRLRRRRGTRPNTPYISFGTKSTLCLGLFALIYFMSMLFFQPMLHDEDKMEHFKKVKDKIVIKRNELVGKMREEGRAWTNEIRRVRGKDRIRIDEELMEKSWQQFLEDKRQRLEEKERASRAVEDNGKKTIIHEKENELVEHSHQQQQDQVQVKQDKKDNLNNDKPTKGFMVLGMHRSGTSMLSGLLVDGFGYQTGGPLIQPNFDNERGFFELLPVVLQNDEFMYNQNVNWAANVAKYDFNRALEETKKGNIATEKLTKALSVLNNPDYVPWLQKDPRMCITLKTWLPYLDSKPAVIFTYRHPLEVAMSLHKREMGFTIARGLRLWIMYNKAAIRNSVDLCRVFSSNNAILADPLGETKRIVDELTNKCGVPPSPKQITQEIVDGFVDPTLQHNKKQVDAEKNQKKILETHGDCEIRDYDSLLEASTNQSVRDMERKLYLTAMRIYCDFQSGDAYQNDYEWPEL